MSEAAQKAWEDYRAFKLMNPDWEEPFLAGFAAGFDDGQVAVIDHLRAFLPEWNYPDYVVAAICLEIKARIARDHDE